MSVRVPHARSVALIEAVALRKAFRKPEIAPGIHGSFRHLIRPRFSEHVAVDGIDLSVAQGEAVAYVGPNGAGKSTTVKCSLGSWCRWPAAFMLTAWCR